MAEELPGLSVVLATRDDEYGFAANRNLGAAISDIQSKAASVDIDTEVVVVDWFSEPGRSVRRLLSDAGVEGVMIVEVSEQVAQPYVSAAKRPFVEYVAKSVGIAHASRAQVLVTNGDIRISSRALEACVSRPFADSSFLRVDRTDYVITDSGTELPVLANLRHGFNEASPASVVIEELPSDDIPTSTPLPGEAMDGDFIVGPPGGLKNHFLLGMHTNASGDFIAAPRSGWHKANGFATDSWTTTMGDSLMCARLQGAGYRQVILTGPRHALHREHPRTGSAYGAWDEAMWPDFKDLLLTTATGRQSAPDERASLSDLREQTSAHPL